MPKSGLNNKYDSLLAHILRCPAVFHAALRSLKPSMWDDEFFLSHRMIWASAISLYEGHDSMPKSHPLIAGATDLIDRHQIGDPAFQDRIKQDIVQLIEAIFVIVEDNFVPSFAMQHLQEFVNERRVLPAAAELSQAKDAHAFNRAFESFSRVYHASRVIVPQPVNLFGDEVMDSLYQIRRKTGLSFVDDLMGGISDGEVYGLLGGSGSGKTLLSLQLAVTLSLQGYRVNFFTYEQPAKGDIPRRIYSIAGNIPTKDLRDTRRGHWPDHIKDRVADIQKTIGPHLQVYDMSGRTTGYGGILEVEDVLNQNQLEAKPPILTIIDWLQVSVDRVMVADTSKKEAILRTEILRYIDRAKTLAGKFGGSWLIVHQLAPAKLGGPGHMPKWTDAAEAKSFAWLMNACITMGMPSDDGFLKLRLDKNRGGKKADTTIRFDDVIARFNHAGDYKWVGRNDGFVKDGETLEFESEKPDPAEAKQGV